VDFKPVETGIQGATDVEVTSGLNEGQEIVTGSYKVLRTLKVGAKVKVDNTVAKKDDNS
jgi:HlyD family secretion protein